MKVVFVVGSTASGKSDWALQWALKYGGVIVNCDSIQVYKKLDVGSAKPSHHERSLCPHYLFDYVNPPQEMTAGVYQKEFHDLLQRLASEPSLSASVSQDTPVFVVGGTGFYFQAIEKGMYETPVASPELKMKIESEAASSEGLQKLYLEIQQRDPAAADKIKPQDPYRITRAIEVLRMCAPHENITSLREKFEAERAPFPYPLLKVGPVWERDELRKRIELRTRKMLEAGLIEEVQGLLAEGLSDWSPLQSVGYKEVIQYLEQNQTKEWLFQEIVTHTYQLAKRQRTWFQREKDIHWFSAASGPGPAGKLVEEFLVR